MSDYTITGAVASYNPTNPAKIPEFSSVTIDVELTYAGTIVTPIDLSAIITSVSGDAVSWTPAVEVLGIGPGEDLKFTVTAQANSVVQATALYQQNYLVTVTDNSGRVQVFNIALDNEDGYPTATLDVIAGYPSPRGIANAPGIPTGLVLTQISSTQYDLTWVAGGGVAVTGYRISRAIRSGAGDGTYAILVNDTGTTNVNYSDIGLTPYTRYRYKVAALNAIIGESDYSDPSATISDKPTNFSVDKLGGGQHRTSLDLTWTTPVDSVGSEIIGYQIERDDGGGWFIHVANTGLVSTVYEDTGLTPSTLYKYRVAAINGVGVTGPSNEDSITTDAITVPFIPTSLVVTAVGANQIDLSWTAPDDGGSPITDYQIERESPVGGGWAVLPTPVSPATNYQDTTVLSGTQYNYRVSAINALGTGSPSSPANDTTPATVPSAPIGLLATPISNVQIDLSWTAGHNGGYPITGYKIERESPVGGGWSPIVLDTGSPATIYTDTPLTPVTQYNYRVYAINTLGAGPASNESNAWTPA